jgi:hypothetical protein
MSLDTTANSHTAPLLDYKGIPRRLDLAGTISGLSSAFPIIAGLFLRQNPLVLLGCVWGAAALAGIAVGCKAAALYLIDERRKTG